MFRIKMFRRAATATTTTATDAATDTAAAREELLTTAAGQWMNNRIDRIRDRAARAERADTAARWSGGLASSLAPEKISGILRQLDTAWLAKQADPLICGEWQVNPNHGDPRGAAAAYRWHGTGLSDALLSRHCWDAPGEDGTVEIRLSTVTAHGPGTYWGLIPPGESPRPYYADNRGAADRPRHIYVVRVGTLAACARLRAHELGDPNYGQHAVYVMTDPQAGAIRLRVDRTEQVGPYQMHYCS